MGNCGRCHTCGAKLRRVLDGEEWCPKCEGYRRYRSHGWKDADKDSGRCPAEPNLAERSGTPDE